MLSQTDLHKPHPYAIVEADEHDGELKTHNVPSNEVQRPIVTNREETAFAVEVRLATCVHGHMDGPGSSPASLMIFEYEIHSKKDKSVVKSLQTSFKFLQNAPGSPDVVAYAPYVRRRYNFSKGEVTTTHGFEAEVGAPAGPIDLGVGYEYEKEKSREQQYFEKVESWQAGYDERQKRHDAVFYKFTQNKGLEGGVTPFFRTAVLLKRGDQARFTGHFKLKFDGGFSYNAGRSFNKVLGEVPDDPINFDPSADPIYGDAKVELEYLGRNAKGRELNKSLAPIWGVDTHVGD